MITKDIRTGIESVLTAADLKVGSDSVNIIMGEKVRVDDLRPPSVWVFFEPSPIENPGQSEYWRFNIIVASVIYDGEPQDGLDKAEQLAYDASQALISDKTLDGNVHGDVLRTQFFPGYTRGNVTDKLFGAGYALEIRQQTDC